ncbi:hypothetical protein EYF80_063836 [Liparis tanakae]|uniref:Uncharacterized protein n=1 Tax=Liparis tanakae TaxID=230148 RepID=A0A4Z2EB33_9TELE|nr:hypothetical protein EYF80_063836 [Liparis tanakae]
MRPEPGLAMGSRGLRPDDVPLSTSKLHRRGKEEGTNKQISEHVMTHASSLRLPSNPIRRSGADAAVRRGFPNTRHGIRTEMTRSFAVLSDNNNAFNPVDPRVL